MDKRAYLASHLSGTPSLWTGTSTPSCLLLKNRLYINNLVYLKRLDKVSTTFYLNTGQNVNWSFSVIRNRHLDPDVLTAQIFRRIGNDKQIL